LRVCPACGEREEEGPGNTHNNNPSRSGGREKGGIYKMKTQEDEFRGMRNRLLHVGGTGLYQQDWGSWCDNVTLLQIQVLYVFGARPGVLHLHDSDTKICNIQAG
jgi:hypothetical protein